MVPPRLVVEPWYSRKEPSHVSQGGKNNPKRAVNCSCIPQTSVQGRESPRLYETLKPCRHLDMLATVAGVAVIEGRCVVLATDGWREFVSSCSCKEGLPQPLTAGTVVGRNSVTAACQKGRGAVAVLWFAGRA